MESDTHKNSRKIVKWKSSARDQQGPQLQSLHDRDRPVLVRQQDGQSIRTHKEFQEQSQPNLKLRSGTSSRWGQRQPLERLVLDSWRVDWKKSRRLEKDTSHHTEKQQSQMDKLDKLTKVMQKQWKYELFYNLNVGEGQF